MNLPSYLIFLSLFVPREKRRYHLNGKTALDELSEDKPIGMEAMSTMNWNVAPHNQV